MSAGRIFPLHLESAPATAPGHGRDVVRAQGPGAGASPAGPVADLLGRPLRELRISVTDRCNFRCPYCMPRATFDAEHPYIPHSQVLRFEEVERLAGIFAAMGVAKFRLTGGEPLLRRDLPDLVARLASVRRPDGEPVDLALTTNGVLLRRLALPLARAGLRRLTISLDALDPAVFRRMSDTDTPVGDVLAGIDAALDAGFAPIKLNMVLQRGANESELLPLLRYARARGLQLRVIEYMDVGNSNGWRHEDVVPTTETLARIGAEHPFEPVPDSVAGAVSERWRYLDGGGEFGTISSVSRPFCRQCTRARLSVEGRLYLCLFGREGLDLRAPLRAGADDAAITAAISRSWAARQDRYSELRAAGGGGGERIEMSYIGG